MMKRALQIIYLLIVIGFLVRAEVNTWPMLDSALRFKGPTEALQAEPVVYNLSPLEARRFTSMFLGGPRRSSTVAGRAPNYKLLQAKWKIEDANNSFAEKLLTNSPAVDESGFYVADNAGFLRAYRWDGSLQWQFYSDAPGGFAFEPINDEDTVYLGDLSGRMYAFNKADGGIRWILKMGPSLTAAPILFNESLYALVKEATGLTRLQAIDARSGKVRWSSPTFKVKIALAPALDEQFKFIYTWAEEGLKAFNLEGKEMWSFKVSGEPHCAPMVLGNRVVLRTGSGQISAVLSASGISVWKASVDGDLGCPSQLPGGVFVPGTHGSYVVDAQSGELLRGPGGAKSTPLVILFQAQTVIVYGCEQKTLCVQDLRDFGSPAKFLQKIALPGNIIGSPKFFNGQLIVAVDQGGGVLGFGP